MSTTNKRKNENITNKNKIISENLRSEKKMKKSFSKISTREMKVKLENNSNEHNDIDVKKEPLDLEELDYFTYKDSEENSQNDSEVNNPTRLTVLKAEERSARITDAIDPQPTIEDKNNSSRINKEGSLHRKKRIRKIVDEQRLALRFIQIALLKFQRVADDLQELLEMELEEQIGYLPSIPMLENSEEKYVNQMKHPSTSRKRLKKSKINHPSSSKSLLKDVLAEERLHTESDLEMDLPEGEMDYFQGFPSENNSNTNSGLEVNVASCSADLLQSLRGMQEHSVLTPDANYHFEVEESSLSTKSSSSRREQGSCSTSGNRKRPCPFCGVLQAKLSRHLQLKHKHEPVVARAINSSRDERVRLFSELRKLGIEKAKERISEDENVQANERILESVGGGYIPQEDFVMCSRCSGYYSRSKFKSHLHKCLENVPEKEWEYYSPDVVLQEL